MPFYGSDGTLASHLDSRYVEQNEPQKSLLRYIATNCLIGCGAGFAWGVLLLITNTAGLADLVIESSNPAATGFLFLLGSIIAFLPAVLATAIGSLSE